MRTLVRKSLRVLSCSLTLTLAPACDGGGDDEAAGTKAEASKTADGEAAKAGTAGLDAAIEKEIENAAAPQDVKGEVRTFLKDQRKLGCEMLPPDMVASTLDVPEAELEQFKIMGCNYKWEKGEEMAEASLMSIWVKKDAEQARRWFENSTKNQTKEELQAAMKMVTQKAKESKSIDTKTKEKTVDTVGGMAGAMMPDEGYQYEDVAGIGDAARMASHDHALTVLVGNMIFTVRAYKGPVPPPPDPKLIMSRDMDKIMAASKKAEKEHMAASKDVRRELGVKLAKAIVAKL